MEPETKLWRAVIGRALMELVTTKDQNKKKKVLEFFKSDDLKYICDLINLNYNNMLESFYKLDKGIIRYE